MDTTARRIIEIDKDTLRLKEKTDEIIAEKEKRFLVLIDEMEQKYKREGELKEKELYENTLSEAKKRIEVIEKEQNKIITSLEGKYNKKKTKLVEDIWQDLFMEE